MAKQTKSAPPAKGSKRPLVLVALAAIVLVVVAVLVSPDDGNMVTEPLTTDFAPEQIQRAQGISWGDENAPVLLYEFADYQCPHCAQFATFLHPLIKERLIDPGIARLVRYDFPLRGFPHSFLAARAARCAGELGQYWEYHDVLYGRQPSWSAETNPASTFVGYAELLGMDGDAFEQCLRSDRFAEEVTLNLRLGESLGVSGTPTILMNGERITPSDYTELEEQVLEAAGRTPAAATEG